MKITKNHRNLLITLIIVIAILTGLSFAWSCQNVHQLRNRRQSRMSPIIMIPGSSATVNRFDSMVAKINNMDHKRHS